jgi:hypothetical protein
MAKRISRLNRVRWRIMTAKRDTLVRRYMFRRRNLLVDHAMPQDEHMRYTRWVSSFEAMMRRIQEQDYEQDYEQTQ